MLALEQKSKTMAEEVDRVYVEEEEDFDSAVIEFLVESDIAYIPATYLSRNTVRRTWGAWS